MANMVSRIVSLFLITQVARGSILPRASVPTKLPGTWSFVGCYTDQSNGVRTLSGATFSSTTAMTVESCISFCSSQNPSYIYAGVEFAQECWCGNSFAGTNTNVSISDCSSPCTGNSAETCGAGNRLNVFTSGQAAPAGPVAVPSVGKWKSIGCYTDNAATRSLGTVIPASNSQTIETCTSACFTAGFPLAGTEFSTECYCGKSFQNGGAPAAAADCTMSCAGNSSELCGGPNRLNVYNYTGTDLPTNGGGSTGGGGGGTGGGSTGGGSGGPTTGNGIVTSGLPSGWAYSACYIDNAFGRDFIHQEADNNQLTIESCINTCKGLGFTIAGTEFGTQCFCGNNMINGATKANDGCTTPCAGKTSESCGGANRLSVYTSTPNFQILPVPSVKTTGLATNWAYQGCWAENGPGNLPYKMTWLNNNTVDACIAQCQKFGLPVAGLEFGQECWCGDKSDLTVATLVADNACTAPCTGDPVHYCGNPGHLTLYEFSGNIDTFHTPANKGRYEFLIGGVVVPLISTLGINNKVTFLEKSGTSPFPNSTGAYELDLSLTNDFAHAWRAMHVKSDVFCSAALVLPDKSGRLINVGGWSGDSTKGIRLYTPDGSAGVNGTNDWEENFSVLHLQRQRWYPSAVLLTNGSILVVGGEVGSNGANEPSLEILPTPPGGPTYLNMDWLVRTDTWNLYPFLMILPTGNVFAGYYNEARILDKTTFNTVKALPNMPGSVNDFLAGRTYPLEGAAVMLPQFAPYTDPVQILICGGSTEVENTALDTCVSIAPEASNPTWLIERMPSKRVMPCMAALPDGTYLIVNGAHHGRAGFNLANDPNLSALLYDPSQPPHQRISVLGNTIVARLYHSEATLLPDGRVLISGSDPNPDTPLTGQFPEEFRVEVYLPPYLTSGLKPPTFTLATTDRDWTYGSQHTISNIQLFQGTASGIRISLIAATSSTHGAIMGGRTLFPAVNCSGTTCTVTAPPNVGVCPPGWFQLFVLDGPTPSRSVWIRIGGDPGKLGSWPPTGGFKLPGV